MEIQDTEISLVIYAGTVMIFLLIVLLFLFVLFHQHKKSIRKKLMQRSILQATIDTQDGIRKQIAADLHDSVGSKLMAVRVQLGRAADGSEGAVQIIQDNLEELTAIQNEVRDISHGLMPPELSNLGLGPALSSLATRLSWGDISFDVVVPNELELNLTPEMKVRVFRITQELLMNASKHSKASKVSLIMSLNGMHLTIDYFENASGFEFEESLRSSKGVGLRNLKARIESAGGQITQSNDRNELELNISLEL